MQHTTKEFIQIAAWSLVMPHVFSCRSEKRTQQATKKKEFSQKAPDCLPTNMCVRVCYKI
jgi:hypothetical protein